MLYAAGEARRGALALLAEWNDTGTLLIVKLRGAANDQVKLARRRTRWRRASG